MAKISRNMLELSSRKTKMMLILNQESQTSNVESWLHHLVILEELACMPLDMVKVRWRKKRLRSLIYSLECIIQSIPNNKNKPLLGKTSRLAQLLEELPNKRQKCNKLLSSPTSLKLQIFMLNSIERLTFSRIDCMLKQVSTNINWIKNKIIMKNLWNLFQRRFVELITNKQCLLEPPWKKMTLCKLLLELTWLSLNWRCLPILKQYLLFINLLNLSLSRTLEQVNLSLCHTSTERMEVKEIQI